MLNYLDRMVADGFGRAALVGALSTGLVGGGAGTVILVAQPLLVIGIPANIVLRPLYISLSVQPGIETTDSNEVDALIGVDSLGLWSGDGTKTDEEPSNMNPRFGKGSACRVASAVTADLTTTPKSGAAAAAPVVDMELARTTQTTNFGDATGISHRETKIVYEPNYPDWLEGPCTLFVNAGGSIATVGCFITAKWVEASPQAMRDYAGYGANVR